MDNDKIQVITAGGAANLQRETKRKKRKKKKKKKQDAEPPTDTVVVLESGDHAIEDTPVTLPYSDTVGGPSLELEESEQEQDPSPSNNTNDLWPDVDQNQVTQAVYSDLLEVPAEEETDRSQVEFLGKSPITSQIEDLYQEPVETNKSNELVWLFLCFIGIMASFVCYGLLLEYTTSGGRKLHELSFLFVTSGLYTITAAAGRYVRAETPTTIPPARFAVLGLTSMGSTFCSVRSLRYVIYPIQVLAKSCKPVPVMLMGALMGKKYNLKKYFNVSMIVLGVALFMGGGNKGGKKDDDEKDSSSQIFGIILLFISLCFDGGTGAYEDKLMSVHSVQPFDLMYNIQLGKTILAGVSLLVLNQLHIFIQMCQEMGFLLVALGLSGAMGQVFIFVTISKFGALTCSIIGLARKVTTLVASIYFYGHVLNGTQFTGLLISVSAMVLNFMGKSKKGGHGHAVEPPKQDHLSEEMQRILDYPEETEEGDLEMPPTNRPQ